MSVTLLPNHLELVKNIAKTKGFEDFQLEIDSGKQKGDGYLSNIILVSIKSSGKTWKILLKTASDSTKLREKAPVRKVFLREIFIYKNVFKHYENILKDSGIVFTPTKSYGYILDENEECLVLENLKANGFQMWNRKLPMDHNHVDLTFRVYAKFHALSFVTQYLYPDKFKTWLENAKTINKYFFVENSDEQFKRLLNNIMDLYDDEQIKRKLDQLAKDWRKVFFPTIEGKHTVLTHGDCWCNNFLYKYENSSDSTKPTDIRLIDFQLAAISTPVHDLCYLLFADTDKQCFTRYRHYLVTYHNTMSGVLKHYGLDINVVYPYKILKEQWEENTKYGLLSAFLVLKPALISDEDALDMNELAESDSDFVESFMESSTVNAEYNSRVKDLVNFFVDNNWL